MTSRFKNHKINIIIILGALNWRPRNPAVFQLNCIGRETRRRRLMDPFSRHVVRIVATSSLRFRFEAGSAVFC